MYWANVLHIYQPPTQTGEILEKVVKESYRPILKILKRSKGGRLTLNINACLCDLLFRHGFSDVIDDIGMLAQSGWIELTASAKYHPILPLIPCAEIERQVDLNRQGNERYFKGVYRPKGLFPPEMCYSKKVARLARAMGFEWIIIDEIGYDGMLGKCRNDRLYTIKGLGSFRVMFKERRTSAAISRGQCRDIRTFRRITKATADGGGYVLTGNDGETYGHHIPGQEGLLAQIFDDTRIRCCTVSDLGMLFGKEEEVEPLPSSWSAWEDEMRDHIPYPQWRYPGNPIHRSLWALARLAVHWVTDLEEKYGRDKNWRKARHLLDQGLHSCQWWWASCRPWWGPRMTEAGAALLAGSLAALGACGLPRSVIRRALGLRQRISITVKKWNMDGKAGSMQDAYLLLHKEAAGPQ